MKKWEAEGFVTAVSRSIHKPVPGLFGCWISPELGGLGGKFHGPEGSQPLQCVLEVLGELRCKCCSPSASPHHPAMPCQHLPCGFAHSKNISDQKVPMKSKVSSIHATNMSSFQGCWVFHDSTHEEGMLWLREMLGEGFNWVVPAGPVRFDSTIAEGEQRVEISLQSPG